MEDLVKIGHTQKPHGLQGELKVSIEEDFEEDFMVCDTVFLSIKGKQIPFFVDSIRGGNFLIVKFEDYDSIEKAKEIQGKDLYIRQRDLIPAERRVKQIGKIFDQIVGYLLVDKTLGDLALIEEIIEMPQQEMAIITYKKKEVLIPLHASLLLEVLHSEKKVLMDLPEGLLDL